MTRIAALALLTLAACENPPMTAAEQWEAVALSVETARMDGATDDIIEVTTDFTLGQAAAEAAANLRDWWQSQAPCATVTLESATLTIDFGTTEGCMWNGQSWTGQAAVAIVSAGEGEAVVEHTWTDLDNGVGALNGAAIVTWSAAAASRRVELDAQWTGAEHTIDVTSDRTIARLEPGGAPGTGIVVDGHREWTLDGTATWSTHIDGVQMRAQDPAPQAGSYTIVNPKSHELVIRFERIDEDTIAITAEGRTTRTWHVTSEGVDEV